MTATLLFTAALQAITPQVAGPQQWYTVDTWLTEDGLPQNSVTTIAQGPTGYLWLSTWGGPVKFDGVRFTRVGHDLPNQQGARHTHTRRHRRGQ